jgi:hypothetical protein
MTIFFWMTVIAGAGLNVLAVALESHDWIKPDERTD